MDGKMMFVVDDRIPTVLLIGALNELGLTITNAGGFRFRLHPLKSTADVIARLQRRRDCKVDAQMRAGMKHLFRVPAPPPEPPAARDVTGRTPPPDPPGAA